MPIQNGYGLTNYRHRMGRNPEGTIADSGVVRIQPYANPWVTNLWTVAVGGTAADGIYRIRVTEAGTGVVHDVQIERDTTPATNADIAAALRAAAPASLRGVGALGGSSTNVTFTGEHKSVDFTVTTSAPSGATLTATQTRTTAGVTLPFGRFVINGGASEGDGLSIASLPAAAAAADLVGVTVRPHIATNLLSRLASAADGYAPGQTVSVLQDGSIEMLNAGGDAAADGLVYCVVATAGGNEIGQARGSADSTNTVALAKIAARWVEATPAGQRGPIHVRIP